MSENDYERGYIKGWSDCQSYMAEDMHLETALENIREMKDMEV